jgi:class 3 adenylate cyclase
LFCDLVGSTALAATMDPEEWRDVVMQYQKAASDVVARFGGHVAKTFGDGLLVYFGWPTAHGDDSERAVRAGLAIRDAIATLAARLEMTLPVRVGMDTGLVVIAEDGEVYGDPPNVASRVQALCEPGTVLVTAATHRLVSGLFLVEERGAHQLKGVPAPVVLFQVAQPSGVRSKLAVAAARGLTPFVGRENERQLLASRFEQAREGKGQVALLVGEPGIGKSRLAHVLHEDLAGVPHTWLECGGTPYFANTPFYALTELLRQFFAWRENDSVEVRVAALTRALENAGLDVIEALPLVAPLLDLPVPEGYPPQLVVPEVAGKRLVAMIAAWVFGIARLQPLVILLEDLHWVDPSTLELTELLVEQGATAPLLLLFTARPEFTPRWALRAHHTQLTLNRLPRRDAREMVTHVAARAALPAEVADVVVTRTDGVPLFVEELTKAVIEAGTTEALGEIPATLADSLMARLDRLGTATKEVAQVGSVLGRRFALGLLRSIHSGPEADLETALEKLVDAELVYPEGLPPEVVYVFRHALVQDAAYSSLLKSRRRALHARVGKVLLEQFADVAETQPELLAHHFTEAREIAPAVEAWRRAGERTLRRGAPSEAARHLRRGLEVVRALPQGPVRDAHEFHLQLSLGQALTVTKGYGPEMAAAFAQAQALGEVAATPSEAALLLVGLWGPTLSTQGPAVAAPLAARALAAAERAGLAPGLVWAHLAQGANCYHAGDLAGSRTHLRCALALYDETPVAPVPFNPGIGALGFAALTAWHLGLADEARKHAREGLARAERSGLPADRAWAERFAAILHQLLGNPAAVRVHAERAIMACAEEPNPTDEAIATAHRGWAMAAEGQLPEGIAIAREGTLRMLATGMRVALEHLLTLLADALARADNVADALTTLAEAEGAVPGEEVWRAETLRLRAELLARHGADSADVEAIYHDALAWARRQGAKAYELRTAMSFARWVGGHGRTAEGRNLLTPIYASFTEGFDTPDLIEANALLAELA